ncbi:MAG: hemerythrin domain-containing protein [Hyphomicrobiaceae bacterium]|nr:hemerythrin domain-containing protein [Hyphomicrobiaceae bacterium]
MSVVVEPGLKLSERQGLPDALRVLLEQHPRADWGQNAHFHGLSAYWLDRHLLFRRIQLALTADAQAVLDRELSGEDWHPRLARLAQMQVSELHGHHMIEDAQYFPILRDRDRRLVRGFDILDADHEALDGHLIDLITATREALTGPRDGGKLIDMAAGFHRHLLGFGRLLERHLDDEEDLIVPVLLEYGDP